MIKLFLLMVLAQLIAGPASSIQWEYDPQDDEITHFYWGFYTSPLDGRVERSAGVPQGPLLHYSLAMPDLTAGLHTFYIKACNNEDCSEAEFVSFQYSQQVPQSGRRILNLRVQ